jgi:hypothetical protein
MADHPDDKTLKALPGRVAALRQALRGSDPLRLAENTGAEFHRTGPEQGFFRLLLWGQEVQVEYPSFSARNLAAGKELSIDQQALLLFYFQHAHGSGPEGRLISFSELPEGKFYNAAFQGYSGNALAQAFKEDRAAFQSAAEKLGGQSLSLGQAAYAFRILPKVTLGIVYWEGDEDFPAAMQVLFDTAAVRHLPTDVCAVAGGMLAGRILKAAGKR